MTNLFKEFKWTQLLDKQLRFESFAIGFNRCT